MRASLLARLDAGDRALLGRWVLDELTPARVTRGWRVLTHLGGARASILAVLLAYALGTEGVRRAAWHAGASLLLSHLFVQLVKRRLRRGRPMAHARAHAEVPDEFSFPSGHSAAAMSVAFAFAVALPTLAVPLLLGATLVGFSRVRLGVHYPGDVLAGQAIAIATVLALRAAGVPQ